MKKYLLLSFILGFLLAGCNSLPVETQSPSISEETTETMAIVQETTEPPAETQATLPTEEHFLMTFVGDCTLGCSPGLYGADEGFVKVVGEDYGYPFQNVRPYFEQDDLTCINLEGALSDEGYPMHKAHTFRGPEAYTQILTGSSVDLVTLANNHSMDYGPVGYESTVRVLSEAGIPYVERDMTRIIELDRGLTVGFYGAVYYNIDQEAMETAIRDLAEKTDFVIFAAHWGAEGSYHPTEQQVLLAHAAIDAGADFVWGHHPHVLQNMEQYQDGIICYSLGNFSFGGNIYPKDLDTALVQLDVGKNADGNVKIHAVSAVPASISSVEKRNNFQPTPYEKDSEAFHRVVSKLDGTWEGFDLTIENHL